MGKSALFGVLTGRYAVSGNREGVTVAEETAPLARVWAEPAGLPGTLVTDLPGIRDMPPRAPDEMRSLSALKSASPGDAVLVVADAERLSEGLRLYAALRKHLEAKGICPLLAVNRCDRLRIQADTLTAEKAPIQVRLDEEWLSGQIGAGAVGVSAYRRWGIDRLVRILGQPHESCSDCRVCPGCGSDGRAFSVDRIARHAEEIAAQALLAQVPSPSPGQQRLDRILTHGASGIIVLLAVWFGLLTLAFGAPGNALCRLLDAGVSRLTVWGSRVYPVSRAGRILSSLWQEGICGGIGAVLSFLPRLTLLWLGMQALEQCGYLPRAARLAHPFMRRLGLTGEALIPLLLGFGCTVPAAMSTRTLPEAQARRRVLCLLPAVSCSARMPVFSLLARSFFPQHTVAFCAALYGLSVLITVISAWVWARAGRALPAPAPDSRPLPSLRVPSFRAVLAGVGLSLSHFARRVGSVILLSSLLSWLLLHTSTGLSFSPFGGAPDCLLYALGRLLHPLLAPLGLTHPALGAALLSGIGAKESVASVLAVSLGADGAAPDIPAALAASGWMTDVSAVAFAILLTFSLPCTAALSALRTESNKPDVFLPAALCLTLTTGWTLARLWVMLAGLLG